MFNEISNNTMTSPVTLVAVNGAGKSDKSVVIMADGMYTSTVTISTPWFN